MNNLKRAFCFLLGKKTMGKFLQTKIKMASSIMEITDVIENLVVHGSGSAYLHMENGQKCIKNMMSYKHDDSNRTPYIQTYQDSSGPSDPRVLFTPNCQLKNIALRDTSNLVCTEILGSDLLIIFFGGICLFHYRRVVVVKFITNRFTGHISTRQLALNCKARTNFIDFPIVFSNDVNCQIGLS